MLLVLRFGLEEAPRELAEGIILYVFGLVTGGVLAHRHIVKPARRRHEEVMEAHRKTHDHLGVE
jgi:hypothetical protein